MANPTARHHRRRRTVAVRRSQRASHACRAQCCVDVLDIRRLDHLGRKSLRLGWMDVTAALPSLHLSFPRRYPLPIPTVLPPPAIRCCCARAGSASMCLIWPPSCPSQPDPTLACSLLPHQRPTQIPALGAGLRT